MCVLEWYITMTSRKDIESQKTLIDAFNWLDGHIVFKKHVPSSDKGKIIQEILLWLIKEGNLKHVRGKVTSTGHYEPIGKTKLPVKNVFFDIVRDSIFVFPPNVNPNNYDFGHCKIKYFDDEKYLRYYDVRVDMHELSTITILPEHIIQETDYINILTIPYVRKKDSKPQRRGAETINKEHYMKRQKIINTYKQLYDTTPSIRSLSVNELTDLLHTQLKIYSKDTIKSALNNYQPSATIEFDDDN